MRRGRKKSRRYQPAPPPPPPPLPLDDDTGTLAMIQALIRVGLRAVEEASQQGVTALAGARYVNGDGRPDVVRWGT